MKIGINLLNISSDYVGGINTYAIGLLEGFGKLKDNFNKFNLYVTPENERLFKSFELDYRFKIIVLRNYDSLFKRRVIWKTKMWNLPLLHVKLSNLLYRSVSKKLSEENEIVYFPNTVIFPYNYSVPTVLSMHDIQQTHYPEFFKSEEIRDRKISYESSAKNLTFLQASSKFMKDDFLRYFYFLSDNQVVTIPEGVDIDKFRNSRDSKYLYEKYGIPNKFIYYPAQLWFHKNHIVILKALKKIKEKEGLEIPLILTGAEYSAAESIFEYVKVNKLKVYYLGKVPFYDLVSLYQSAKIMVTAVLYESSSLPVLEAAAAGTPIIASATPPNVELSKVLKLHLFNPLDEDEFMNLLLTFWNNEKMLQEQIEHNIKNIIYYSWSNVAKSYIEIFNKINKGALKK